MKCCIIRPRIFRQWILQFLTVSWLSGGVLAQDSTFHLEIQRKHSTTDCVSGYLLINGKVVCYVLERAWQENKPEISSIPSGEYKAFIRNDGKMGWRIELTGVPGRQNIQIHVGNKTADSKGCLLPGKGIDPDSLCTVTDSKGGMNLLKDSLAQWQEKLQQSVPIKVKVSGVK